MTKRKPKGKKIITKDGVEYHNVTMRGKLNKPKKKIEDWERIIKLQVCECGTFGYCKKCLPIIELIKSLLQEKEEEMNRIWKFVMKTAAEELKKRGYK